MSIVVNHDGRTWRLRPEHVAYRPAQPITGTWVKLAKYAKGKLVGGVSLHPVIRGQKLEPVVLREARPGEQLLFWWPWHDLRTLQVGEVAS